jgi:hypothetical protein
LKKDSPMPKLKISMPEYNGLSSITMARETKIFSSIVYRFISAQHLKKRFNHFFTSLHRAKLIPLTSSVSLIFFFTNYLWWVPAYTGQVVQQAQRFGVMAGAVLRVTVFAKFELWCLV